MGIRSASTPAASKNGERGFQFPLALLAAAGIRVVEQRGLAHSVGRSWIVPEDPKDRSGRSRCRARKTAVRDGLQSSGSAAFGSLAKTLDLAKLTWQGQKSFGISWRHLQGALFHPAIVWGSNFKTEFRRVDQMKILAQVLCGALLCLGATAQDHAAHVQAHSGHAGDGTGRSPSPCFHSQSCRRSSSLIRGCVLFMPSTTTRRRDRFSTPRNSILNWRWPTGASPRLWDRTTTIPPIPIVTSTRMMRCRRRSICRRQPRPASRLISRRWRSGFRPIRIPI